MIIAMDDYKLLDSNWKKAGIDLLLDPKGFRVVSCNIDGVDNLWAPENVIISILTANNKINNPSYGDVSRAIMLWRKNREDSAK